MRTFPTNAKTKVKTDNLWDLLGNKTWKRTRSKKEIDKQIKKERDSWK